MWLPLKRRKYGIFINGGEGSIRQIFPFLLKKKKNGFLCASVYGIQSTRRVYWAIFSVKLPLFRSYIFMLLRFCVTMFSVYTKWKYKPFILLQYNIGLIIMIIHSMMFAFILSFSNNVMRLALILDGILLTILSLCYANTF